MTIPTIFDTCRPREVVLSEAVTEADFGADLAQVVTGGASAEYRDPERFFANTDPMRGLKDLLANVCRRLSRARSVDVAFTLGLLFRTLVPMRRRDYMRAVAKGIKNMGWDEAAYWLGMAMHRCHPRRVLTVLRFLHTEPRRRAAG